MRTVALTLLLASVLGAAEPFHPSLLFGADDIPQLRERVNAGWLKGAYETMVVRAKGFLDVPTDPYPMYGRATNGKATAGRALNNRVSTLALTGMLLDDPRYCRHAVEMAVAAARQADVKDFVEWNGHLAVGDGGHAYAMAYDWLWPYMTPDERALLRAEVASFGQWLYDYSMTGRDYGMFNANRLSCNHNTVVHGGLGLSALALGDHDDWRDRAAKYVRGYLENARDATGYSYEGIGYYAYGSWGAVPFGVALQRATGKDIFEDVPSLRLVPNYVLRQMLPWGREVVAMNDSPSRLGNSGGFMYLLNRYQDRTGLWAWLRLYGPEGDGSYGAHPGGYLGDAASIPYTILFADPSLRPLSPEEANLPLHMFFADGRASFRSGWGDLDGLATFTCGFDRHRGHNHRDENSFTFFARGEEFAIDPAYEPRETRCHNTVIVDGMGQASDPGEYDVYGKTTKTQDFGNAWSVTGDATAAFPEIARVSLARRQLLFVRAANPYLVIADELGTTDNREAEYTWLLHTARTNTIRISKEPNAAIIEGSRRKAICKVQFICPEEGLQVTETDLAGQTFERRGRPHRYDRFFRELRATQRAKKCRFIAILTVGDNPAEFPRVRWQGNATDLSIRVNFSPGHTDHIRITPQSVEFARREQE
jgi:hypothetical protein